MVYVVGTCVLESKQDTRWTWAQSKQPIPLLGLPPSAREHLRRTAILLNACPPEDLVCHVLSASGVRLASFSAAP